MTAPFQLESQEPTPSRPLLRPVSCSGLFDPPPTTEYNFLSLGAGVQSSCLALMAAKGEIGPMPNAAIFADTQAEPKAVMEWLDWLEPQLPFPVIRVTRGSLTEESLVIRERKDGTGHWSKSLIPAFILNRDGSKGIMGRQCTYSYKVEQLERAARKLANVKRGQKEVTVTQWIGISWDELQRIKQSRTTWAQHRWPLIERRMTRQQCLEWMEANGYPRPPRSACIYCPFHSDAEWRNLKDNDPDAFRACIQFENDLQAVKSKTERMKGKPYLHSSMKPLGEVDFATDEERGQGAMDFQAECEGMCGV